jgi:hypothetical protein
LASHNYCDTADRLSSALSIAIQQALLDERIGPHTFAELSDQYRLNAADCEALVAEMQSLRRSRDLTAEERRTLDEALASVTDLVISQYNIIRLLDLMAQSDAQHGEAMRQLLDR